MFYARPFIGIAIFMHLILTISVKVKKIAFGNKEHITDRKGASRFY